MASDEPVEEIVKRVRRECNSYPLPTAAAEMLKLVREFQAAHKREITEKDAEIAKLRTLLASTVGYTCTLCGGMKSSKMCGTCAVFKAQEMLESEAR